MATNSSKVHSKLRQ